MYLGSSNPLLLAHKINDSRRNSVWKSHSLVELSIEAITIKTLFPMTALVLPRKWFTSLVSRLIPPLIFSLRPNTKKKEWERRHTSSILSRQIMTSTCPHRQTMMKLLVFICLFFLLIMKHFDTKQARDKFCENTKTQQMCAKLPVFKFKNHLFSFSYRFKFSHHY